MLQAVNRTLLAVLAVSLALNAVQGWAWLNQHDKAVVSKVEERHATATALECSAGTEALAKDAQARKDRAAPMVAAAASSARQHERQALQIMATPAPPGADACTSAQARIDEWYAKRGQP